MVKYIKRIVVKYGKGIVNNDYRLRGCYVSGSARDVTTTGGWTA